MTQARWRRTRAPARRRGPALAGGGRPAGARAPGRSSLPTGSWRRSTARQRGAAPMRFFDGAAVDGRLAYPGLVDILQAAFAQGRDRASAPPPRDRARRPARGDPAADAGLGGERAGRAGRRPLSGRQDRHRVPRQRRARQAGRARHLSAALGRDRRDAGRDGRHPPHGLAHGRGLGARQPLPVAPRRLAPADGRRRRAGAPSCRARMPRCGRSARWRIWNRSPDRARALARRAGGTTASTSPSPTTWRRPCAAPTSSPPPRSPPSR